MEREPSRPVTTTLRPQTLPQPSSLFPTLGGAAVASVGASLPAKVVRSAEIEQRLGLVPDWIERRTGIRSRRIAEPGERLDRHATIAAEIALERAGVSAEDVDVVVVATSTSDELMPNTAPLVAHALGAERAGAFDIGAACTGFLAGLATGTAMIDSGRASCVVLIGADFMSRLTDPNDRSTVAVFADGAGAVVLVGTGEASRIGPVVLGADGSGARNIVVPRERSWMVMAGHETYREAVARLSEATIAAVEAAEVSLDEIDLFVYHQANARILAAVGERVGIPEDRVVDCIGELGNTSAATIPLALEAAHRDDRLHDGDRVLISAFGAGFTWGATVLEWGVTG